MSREYWVIGCDPGMNSCGIALYTPGGDYALSFAVPLTGISERLETIKEVYRIEHAVLSIEKFPRAHLFREAQAAAAAVRREVKRLWPRRNKVIQVYPQSWRKAMYGRQPKDAKAAALEWCKRTGLNPESHDEAEAIMIGQFGVDLMKLEGR